MAKTLHERIANARANERTPDNQLERLIDEGGAEVERLTAAHDQAAADSVDFALAEGDRDEAAAKADKYRREATALAGAVEALREQLATKRGSDKRQAAEAERTAALAERDEIAARWKDRIPALIAELIELFEVNQRNADRLRAAGAAVPSAEAVARGLPGFRGIAGDAESFAQMKIPRFEGAGRCWPPSREPVAWQVDYAKERDRAAEAARRAKAHEEAQFGRYRVINRTGLPIFFESRHNPRAAAEDVNFAGTPWEGELAHDLARKLGAKPEIEVEPIEAPPSHGADLADAWL